MNPLPDGIPFDHDRLTAAVELVGRAAARSLELGWTDDDGPRPGEWYASAFYRGTRVTVEHQDGPAEAVENLAFRLLEGGQCVHCGRPTVIDGFRLASGEPGCIFRREGQHWLRGCDQSHGPPPAGLNRAQRRRQARAAGLR